MRATQDFYTGVVVTIMAIFGIGLAFAKTLGRVKGRMKPHLSNVLPFRPNHTRRKAG